jgi:glycosyltransferase involved in cell wall biosynthesis
MEAARGVLVGSRHTAESLWAALPDVSGLREKTRLGPPGVDTERFHPRGAGGGGASCTFSSAGRGVAANAPPKKLSGTPARSSRRVVFVGKLIVSKGVDLLLAAWPLVKAEYPDAILEIAGYGEYEEGLRRLQTALEREDIDDARKVALAGWGIEGGEERPLPILSAFLAELPPGYAGAAVAAAGSVEFIGRLEHDEVAELLPDAEALVMPSTFPEAFGMVAAEAAACGVLPVSAGHSGMLEVSKQLMAALPPEVGRLTSFPVEEGAVEAIAERLNGWLSLSDAERGVARESLVETARRLWSWEGVARGAIAASRGELDRLPDA